MNILNSNTGKDIQYILKNHIYVQITDFGLISMLKEIIINPGQHTWCWITLQDNKPVDISDIGFRVCTFDSAVNRAINDPYSTVYEFINYGKLAANWKEVKYIDNIKTVYKIKIE